MRADVQEVWVVDESEDEGEARSLECQRKNAFPSSPCSSSSSSSSSTDGKNAKGKNPAPAGTDERVRNGGGDERPLLLSVLGVLPGVKIDVVKRKILEHAGGGERRDVADLVVTELLSMPGGYPKEEGEKRGATSCSRGKASAHQSPNPTSFDDSFLSDPIYQEQALRSISNDFPRVSIAYLRDILKAAKGHYLHAHRRLDELCRGKREPTPGQIPSLMQFTSDPKVLKGKRSHKSLPLHMHSMLRQQLDHFAEEKAKQQLQEDMKLAKELNEQEAEICGALLECECCYMDQTFEEMVSCSEGAHMFCRTCLRKACNELLYGQTSASKERVQCMSLEGCEGYFAEEFLESALEPSTYSKLIAKLSEKVAQRVCGDALFRCPDCSTPAEVPSGVFIFACPSCGKETCMKCGEPSHVPLRCEEVEKEAETGGRKSVEEAMSEAKIRTCPKCKKRFVKEQGCNKMTCTCSAIMCYICRKQIKNYDHFCRKPHCSHTKCGICALFTNDAQDDELAMRDAGLAAKKSAEEKGVKLKDDNLVMTLLDKRADSHKRPLPPQLRQNNPYAHQHQRARLPLPPRPLMPGGRTMARRGGAAGRAPPRRGL